jgi:hypothetical protein
MNTTPKQQSNVTTHQLEHFFRNLSFRKRIVERTREAFAPILAPSFNAFHFIRPDENCLSDILACLLDPNGSHAQGDIFLVQFLKVFCELSDPLLYLYGSISVRRESHTALLTNNRRRIDLIVHFQGVAPISEDFGVAIENKPWASDQADQIKDYISELQARYDHNFKLVYLSGSHGEPTSLSGAERELFVTNRQLIRDYALRKCLVRRCDLAV